MRRTLLAALSIAPLVAGCRIISHDFRISGTITVAAHLQRKIPRNNAVLFIIAKNMGGVPIAVHRIVNPQFPLSFLLTPEDLLVPAAPPRAPVRIEIQMNSHGNLGPPIRGDLEGSPPNPIYPGERGLHIVIDRQV